MSEQQLLDSARAGDETAFGALVSRHRVGLYVHCYRMLGSPQDAEDALQETLLRAWRGLGGFRGESSARSWLYKIATNSSLRAIERRPRRVLSIDYGPASAAHEPPAAPLVESIWVEPLPDEALDTLDERAAPDARYEQRESVELAFIAALQLLPARQRAVLIMRDVLGFSAREVAVALDATPAAIDSALQRAHKQVDERLPQRSQQATLRALGDAKLQTLVERYVAAWEQGDVEALVAMLTDDVTIAMPPHATWYSGRANVAAFLAGWPLEGGQGGPCRRVGANGQLAFAHYRVDPQDAAPLAHNVTLVTLRGEKIAALTAFLMPHLFARFAL